MICDGPALSCRQLHHHHRRGLQDPDGGHRWGAGEAADLGHGGPGEVQNHHLNVMKKLSSVAQHEEHKSGVYSARLMSSQLLQEHARRHHRVRCDEPRVVCECEEVVK